MKITKNKRKTNNKKGFNRLYAFGEKSSIDLSLSENPLGCSELVSDRLNGILPKLNDYPDARKTRLKKALSSKFKLKADSFFIGNGSESIIINLTKVLLDKGDEVIIPRLTFPMFDVSSKLAGARVVESEMTKDLEISLKSVLKNITEKTKMIFVCNPNNPTGNVISRPRLIEFLKSVPKNTVVVLDEANVEFGGDSLIGQTKKFKNLVVLKTFSKGFGLAAIRVGFCVANAEIVDLLQENTQPFPIGSISEELAIAALNDDSFLETTRAFISFQRKMLESELENLGFRVFPSGSNNLFVKIPDDFREDEFLEKIKEEDISVVKGSSFFGADDSFFRLSPRDVDINKIFLEKIGKIIKSKRTRTEVSKN